MLVNTGACRLYHVTGLDGTDPGLELVHDAKSPACATPVVVGQYWIQANAGARRVFALDVSDLKHIRQTSSVSFDERQRPHWLATDGTRIVVANEPVDAAERRLWVLRLDRSNGQLTLDTEFRLESARNFL